MAADRNAREKYHQLALASGEQVTNSDSLARYMAEQCGVSTSTLWNWKRKFEAGGSFSLARKPRVDKNRSAWAADNRELADLAALVYMGNGEQPAQSKTVAWEAVCDRAERIGIAAPSYETVRAFLENDKDLSRSDGDLWPQRPAEVRSAVLALSSPAATRSRPTPSGWRTTSSAMFWCRTICSAAI